MNQPPLKRYVIKYHSLELEAYAQNEHEAFTMFKSYIESNCHPKLVQVHPPELKHVKEIVSVSPQDVGAIQ